MKKNTSEHNNTRNTNPLYIAYNSGILPECRAKWNKKGNIKLGNMWTFSTLYGQRFHFIEKLNAEIAGTCGHHCEGCEGLCYVASSYRYPSVKLGHARNTLAIRQDIKKAGDDLNGYIDRARKKPAVIRFDQYGEIETVEEFEMFCDIARKHPEIEMYVYTKAYEIVTPALLAGRVPLNLIINISIWHLYGIKEYLKVCHLPNVRAFVVVDEEWTRERYAKHGIIIQAMCPAYDERGHLNHEKPCIECGLCFRQGIAVKVTGCYEH